MNLKDRISKVTATALIKLVQVTELLNVYVMPMHSWLLRLGYNGFTTDNNIIAVTIKRKSNTRLY